MSVRKKTEFLGHLVSKKMVKVQRTKNIYQNDDD